MNHQLAATILQLTAQYFEALAQAVSEGGAELSESTCMHPSDKREPLGMGGHNWRCLECGHIEQPEG